MRDKNKKNSKVPKSAKTRLSDMIPKNDAPGGRFRPPMPTPPGVPPPVATNRRLTL